MGLDFSCRLTFHNENFNINKVDANYPNAITIHGDSYAISGASETIEELSQILKNLDLQSVSSIDELKVKLEPQGISIDQRVVKVSARVFADDGIPSQTFKPAQRRASLPDLRAAMTKEMDIERKQGHLWECIDRKPDPHHSGGYLYTYKLRPPFQGSQQGSQTDSEAAVRVREKNEEISPAVEADQIKDLSLLKDLGYHFDGDSLILPDRLTLMTGWERYRNEHPERNLPPIDIADSAGIASDEAFIGSFFAHTAILSNEKEFVHDHQAHIIPILSDLLDPSDLYLERRKIVENTVMTFLQKAWIVERALEKNEIDLTKEKINELKSNLDIITHSIGALADIFSVSLEGINVNFKSYELDPIPVLKEAQSFVKNCQEVLTEKKTEADFQASLKLIMAKLRYEIKNPLSLLYKLLDGNRAEHLYANNVLFAYNKLENVLDKLISSEKNLMELQEEVNQAFKTFLEEVDSAVPSRDDLNPAMNRANTIISTSTEFFMKPGENRPTFEQMWDLVDEALKSLKKTT